MATTYYGFYLGTSTNRLDPTEGNSNNEGYALFQNTTWGSSTAPLSGSKVEITAGNFAGGAVSTSLETNNNAENATLATTIGGTAYTLVYDGTAIYNATLTYADGTTATVTSVLVQTTDGRLFLMPESTAVSDGDTAKYENKPITSITFGTATTFNNLNFGSNRVVTAFDDGYVDGTAGNDLIDSTYVEPIANGSDRIDNADAGLAGSSGNDDYVRAGAGDDTVRAGAGNDVVYGGNGNDSIEGGIGNDTAFGEAGNDILFGGDGNDSLDGGAGNDSMSGGAGNDTLAGGAGNDTLDGGSGNDSLSGGDGDDTFLLSGTFGNDTIVGGEAGETLGDTLNASGVTSNVTLTFSGAEAGSLSDGTSAATFSEIETFQLGAGNDSVIGGAGNDSVDGGAGNDSMSGGAGNDTLAGGAGNDSLDGGTGNDFLTGEAGNDILTGGEGADRLYGGDDRDTFYGGAGDVVDGGQGGDDYDVLDLTAYGFAATNIIYDPLNQQSGTVEFLDAAGNVTGTLSFSHVEKVIACFTPGTLVLTAHGSVAIEDLKVGDQVLSRDHGFQPIRWIGRRDLTAAELAAAPQFNPVRIAQGALGDGLPERVMQVSPQHRMLINSPRAELLFGEAEVLAAALHLIGMPGITRAAPEQISYFHILFDEHQLVCADGAWSESFQPGQHSLAGLESGQRQEIFALFPDLSAGMPYPAARMMLKSKEAQILLHS